MQLEWRWQAPRRIVAIAVTVIATVWCLGSCAAPTSPLPPSTSASTEQLTILGATVFTAPGQTSQLTVKDATGAVLTSGVTWQTGISTVASVSSTGLLTAIAVGTTGVTAKTINALGSAPVTVVAPAGVPKTVSACSLLNSQGAYVLTADLAATPSTGACLTLNSAVTLDCAGHSARSISIVGTAITVANCVVPSGLTIAGSNTVSLTSDTITGLLIQHAAAVTVTNSTVLPLLNNRPALYGLFTTALVVQGSSITGSGNGFYAVSLSNGSGNQILNNTLTGGYDGSQSLVGADDGVLLINENGDAVQGNTISNFFDAGVEGVNLLTNTTIANNTMTNLGTTGVGSYWCTNFTNNVIRNNSVTQAPTLILINYSIGQFQCGLAGTQNALTGNQIVGNRFRTPITGTQPELPAPTPAGLTAGPAARIIIVFPSPAANNVLQGNDLGTNDGPYLVPRNGFTDGGGNLCGPMNPQVSNFPCAGVGSPSGVFRRR